MSTPLPNVGLMYGRGHSRNILWDTKDNTLGPEVSMVQSGHSAPSYTSVLGPVWLVQQCST